MSDQQMSKSGVSEEGKTLMLFDKMLSEPARYLEKAFSARKASTNITWNLIRMADGGCEALLGKPKVVMH